MSALPDPQEDIQLSPRAQAWYDDVMEQLATIEEREPANIARIKRTIGLYERIYGMSSTEMREKVASGEMEETNDICAWSEHLDLVARIHSPGK